MTTEDINNGYEITNLVMLIVTVYFAFQTQRIFWKSWFFVATVAVGIDILSSLMWTSKASGMTPEFFTFLAIAGGSIGYMRALAIFGLVRGFLLLIRNPYWRTA